MTSRYEEFVDKEMVQSICKLLDKSLNPLELEAVYKHCEYRLYELHDPRAINGDYDA